MCTITWRLEVTKLLMVQIIGLDQQLTLLVLKELKVIQEIRDLQDRKVIQVLKVPQV